ncbi:MAG: hypothetical protein ACFCVK_15715 [Acidimicrobiales bacterium]
MSAAEKTAEYDVVPGARMTGPRLPARVPQPRVAVPDPDGGRNVRLVAMAVFGLTWIAACVAVLVWGLAALLA